MHLGYYIHLHGKGHAQRAKAIASHFSIAVTFIGTGVSRSDWTGVSNYQLLDLPPDRVEYVPDLPINQDCQTYSFHYAPYYSDAYRQRAVALANWVEQTKPTAVVVDVSTEITQYLRWLGVPVIGMRQHGDRSDLPHLCGYDAAYKLFAPYPEILELGVVPSWIRDKTIYSPGFSRYSQNKETKLGAREKLNISPQQEVALVINGKGGGKYSLAKVAAAARATPEWLWLTVGEIDREGCAGDPRISPLDSRSLLETNKTALSRNRGVDERKSLELKGILHSRHDRDYDSLPSNVSVLGWREDTYSYLKAADVAISSGGHNTVMEIGTAQVPFLCIPELRPFQEQQIKARLLEKLGLCFCSETFPDANSARLVLNKLKQLDITQWGRIMAIDGAAQAAKAIESEIKLLNSYLALSSSAIALSEGVYHMRSGIL